MCVFVLVVCICVSLFHTLEGVGCCFFSGVFFHLCLELFLHLLLEDLRVTKGVCLGDRYIGIGMSGSCTGLFEVHGMLTCLLVSKF